MFYTFYQNNSGGYFDDDENLAHYVIIEASNSKEANHKAELIGIYFDGVSEGKDCSCCGDRWSEVLDAFDEGTEFPSIYGKKVPEDLINDRLFHGPWSTTIIHYSNGSKMRYSFDKKY